MIRPGTSISKAKVSKLGGEGIGLKKQDLDELPKLDDYLGKRDWIGAAALLES